MSCRPPSAYRRVSSKASVSVRAIETPLATHAMMSQTRRSTVEVRWWASVSPLLDACIVVVTPDLMEPGSARGVRGTAVGRRSRCHPGGAA